MSYRQSQTRSSVWRIAVLGFLCMTAAGSAQQSKQSGTAELPKTLFRLESAQWSEPYNGPLGFQKAPSAFRLASIPGPAERLITHGSRRDHTSLCIGTRILNMQSSFAARLHRFLEQRGSLFRSVTM